MSTIPSIREQNSFATRVENKEAQISEEPLQKALDLIVEARRSYKKFNSNLNLLTEAEDSLRHLLDGGSVKRNFTVSKISSKEQRKIFDSSNWKTLFNPKKSFAELFGYEDPPLTYFYHLNPTTWVKVSHLDKQTAKETLLIKGKKRKEVIYDIKTKEKVETTFFRGRIFSKTIISEKPSNITTYFTLKSSEKAPPIIEKDEWEIIKTPEKSINDTQDGWEII